jgi:hypothetical protein
MNIEQQTRIIANVMKQAPRYSSSMAGAKTREAYASVDDMSAQHTITVFGDTIEAAMTQLLNSVRRRYPMLTARCEADEALRCTLSLLIL